MGLVATASYFAPRAKTSRDPDVQKRFQELAHFIGGLLVSPRISRRDTSWITGAR